MERKRLSGTRELVIAALYHGSNHSGAWYAASMLWPSVSRAKAS
jgi:hypothetical protein